MIDYIQYKKQQERKRERKNNIYAIFALIGFFVIYAIASNSDYHTYKATHKTSAQIECERTYKIIECNEYGEFASIPDHETINKLLKLHNNGTITLRNDEIESLQALYK